MLLGMRLLCRDPFILSFFFNSNTADDEWALNRHDVSCSVYFDVILSHSRFL